MKYLEQDPIPVLTWRISQLERRQEEMTKHLELVGKEMAKLRQAFLSASEARNHQERVMAEEGLINILSEKNIMVPGELLIVHDNGTRRGRKRGVRYRSHRNRDANTVAKRWALWKTQRAMGYTVQQIARAWGCNHTSIVNAEKNGFKPAYGTNRR